LQNAASDRSIVAVIKMRSYGCLLLCRPKDVLIESRKEA